MSAEHIYAHIPNIVIYAYMCFYVPKFLLCMELRPLAQPLAHISIVVCRARSSHGFRRAQGSAGRHQCAGEGPGESPGSRGEPQGRAHQGPMRARSTGDWRDHNWNWK